MAMLRQLTKKRGCNVIAYDTILELAYRVAMTNVQQLEKWYAAHEDDWRGECLVLRIKTLMPGDEMHGKGGIDVETQTILASLTFWNQGDVEVIAINKVTRKESILDDRKLTPADHLDSLLNLYFHQIVGPAVRTEQRQYESLCRSSSLQTSGNVAGLTGLESVASSRQRQPRSSLFASIAIKPEHLPVDARFQKCRICNEICAVLFARRVDADDESQPSNFQS